MAADDWKTERYDNISTRIVDGAGGVVAMIESFTNGRWGVFVGGRQIAKKTFGSVREAFAWWKGEQEA